MNPAELVEQTYQMTKSGTKDDRIDKVNENIDHTGFKAIKEKSNRDLIFFQDDANKKINIAVRGTDAGGMKQTQDILTDLTFAIGKEGHNKHFNKKIKKIGKLVQSAPDDYEVNLSGHSLAGAIVAESMKKKGIRNRVTHVDTYNAAFSPFTAKVNKKAEADFNSKITNHRIENDLVSASSAVNSFGSVKTYKAKKKKYHKAIPNALKGVFDSLDQLNNHSIRQFTK